MTTAFSNIRLAWIAVGVSVFFLAAICPALAQEALPKTLTLLSANNGDMSAKLENVTYTGTAAVGAPAAGKGRLCLTLGGRALPQIPNVPFENLVFDAHGRVSGGSLSLSENLEGASLFGSGVDLVIHKESRLIVRSGIAGAPADLQLSGAMTARLPFKSKDGARAELQLPAPAKFDIAANGSFTLDVKGAALTGPPAAQGMKLACFTLRAGAMDIKLQRPGANGASFDLALATPTASIETVIPGLLTQEETPITLTATNVRLDADGALDFDGARLDAEKPLQVVHLASPLDFALTVKSAGVTVKEGRFDAFTLQGDLALPSHIQDARGDRVVLENLTFEANHGWLLDVPSRPLQLNWNIFSLQANGFVIDLSSAARAPSLPADYTAEWQGIYLPQATLTLPETFQEGGSPVQLRIEKFACDSSGITGKFLNPAINRTFTIGGYQTAIKSGMLEFSRNQLLNAQFRGEIDVAAWDSKLGLDISISSAGLVSAVVDTSRPLESSKYGGLSILLTGGSLQIQPEGTVRLGIDGVLTFEHEQLADAAFKFKDLAINSNGDISLPDDSWLTLASPKEVDLGYVSLNASQIGFGRRESDRQYWIGVTGGIKVSQDLPVSGETQFEGMKVYENGDIEIGRIHIKANVMEVAKIEARVAPSSEHGGSVSGNASLALCLGSDSQSFGGGLVFVAAKGAWYVMGTATLPGEGIPLGNSGFAIIGFAGGLGHNVRSDPPVATGIPGIHYQLIPDRSLNNWWFVSGVKVKYRDGQTLWGDNILAVAYPPLFVNLYGRVYLLEKMSETPTGDRVGYTDLSWNSGTNTFRASIGADLYFPKKEKPVFEAHGPMELLLAPNKKHLFMGWPRDEQPITATIANTTTVSSGLGISFQPEQYVKTGINWTDKWLGGMLVGTIDGELGITSYDPFEAYGTLSARGTVDFYIAKAYGHGVLAGTVTSDPAARHALTLRGDLTGRVETFLGSVEKQVDFSYP